MADYTLEVYGTVWGGFKSVYSYTISAERAQALIANKPDEDAPDFADVIDWRVVQSTYEYEGKGAIKRRIDTHRTLRGFRNGMTPRRFCQLANRY